MLQRHAGLWITRHKDVMYSQATQINFICPMRFDDFPLDTQVQCSLLELRYNFDIWTSDVPCISLNLIYCLFTRFASFKLVPIRTICQKWLLTRLIRFRGKPFSGDIRSFPHHFTPDMSRLRTQWCWTTMWQWHLWRVETGAGYPQSCPSTDSWLHFDFTLGVLKTQLGCGLELGIWTQACQQFYK